MTSRVFISVLFFFVSFSTVFGYNLNVRTRDDVPSVSSTSGVDLGNFLAFQVLKASLTKNNISFSFGTYGLGASYTINGVSFAQLSGSMASFNTARVILWPRGPLENDQVRCDYVVICTFCVKARNNGGDGYSPDYDYYVYGDYGVINVVKHIGNITAPISERRVELSTTFTNSMPIRCNELDEDYLGVSIRYLNLSYNSYFDDITGFNYGSIRDYANITYYLMCRQGTMNNIVSQGNCYSIRDKTVILQEGLPWQLQLYNSDFSESGQTRPTNIFETDTDQGSEPDLSEYFNGHNYLNDPSDDWGQPADIGGGSSGVGGEITGFSQGAQGQMTSSAQQAITSALGDPTNTTLDIVPPSQTPDQITSKNDIDLDSSFMSSVQQNVSGALPDGVTSFQSIINALKSPDTRHLPVVTLPFTFDLRGFHNGGYFDSNRKPQITFDWLLNDPYRSYYVNGRALVVIFMTVCLVIYIIQDVLFLGGRGSEN